MQITDNVFVVTGGGNGIGREVVLALLDRLAELVRGRVVESGRIDQVHGDRLRHEDLRSGILSLDLAEGVLETRDLLDERVGVGREVGRVVGGELAEVLGISRSGADAALSRARKRLREAWAERLSF